MKHTYTHFSPTKYSLAKALSKPMDSLFALAIDAYQNHHIDYIRGWHIEFTFENQNIFELALIAKYQPNVCFTKRYNWTNLMKDGLKLKPDERDFIKAIHTIYNAVKRNFSRKTDQHILNVLHMYEHQFDIILTKVRWSMRKKGLNVAELMLYRLKKSKFFDVTVIHNSEGKITQLDFETKKILPAVFNQSPDFYKQEKTPLAKGSLKFDYSKKGFDLIMTNMSDFPELIPNQAYLADPDCELSDIDLICLSGKLHRVYGQIQIEFAKILRQNA